MRKHDSHQAYCGLEEVASPDLYEEALNDRIEHVGKHSFTVQNGSAHTYKHVCLLDTFFSDSFPANLLRNLFRYASRDEASVRILLLDPFSDLARIRAESLKRNNSILRLNKGLQKILYALRNRLPPDVDDEFAAEGRNGAFIFEQIDRIGRELASGTRGQIELGFTRDLTEVPIYIIGQFIVKGLISSARSAYENPWCFFVDNPNTQEDLYNAYLDSFNQSWKTAIPFQQFRVGAAEHANRNVFVSYGKDEYAKLKIRDLIQSTDYEEGVSFQARFFEDTHRDTGYMTIPSVLDKAFSECSSAVIILTNDDMLATGDGRARQNVIHELGFAQAKYGEQRVLMAIESGVTKPSNLDGHLYVEFSYTDGSINIDATRVTQFLDRVKRGIQNHHE